MKKRFQVLHVIATVFRMLGIVIAAVALVAGFNHPGDVNGG